MKKIIVNTVIVALLTLSFGIAAPVGAIAPPSWNVTGTYVVSFDGYNHDMFLIQDGLGNVTGNGGYLAGNPYTYAWTITAGTVTGDTINLTMDYTLGAVGTTMNMTGTIAPDGSMSGTWDDNYGGPRTGSWATTSGNAVLLGTLAAEDFGVVNYDTGLGILSGYTAGFGVTDATFAGTTSVVVQLYAAGDQLLQTNTAIFPKFNTDIIGTQFSSPFDVSGTFDYAADGYWTNLRAAEYGQSIPAVKVVATVTLANGKVVTAENTILTGDPTTIYPLFGTLAAEDFGVVNYNTGLGMLKGYTAGFGVTDATFAGATSVVVQLYAGSTLLQTNTAILLKFNADITGTQFSSPFDVSGDFDYNVDGYWTNVRETQFGQSVAATRVVATVTLANGKVVTAENTNLTGDPTTIYPVTPPVTTPTNKDQCKKDGYKTFTDPTFKNQGQCVSYVQANEHAGKR